MSELTTDPVLAAFVRSIERTDLALNITLTTTGGVVAGELVSGAAWAKAYLTELERSPAAPLLQETFEVLAQSLTPRPGGEETEGAGVPQFIHLVQARYLNANGMVPQGHARPWRGRLDQIVAWSFGAMTTT